MNFDKDELREIVVGVIQQIGQSITEEKKQSANRELMTLAQVSDYLQCSKQSVKNWVKRPKDKNPLPVCRAGADPRFFKVEVDLWMKAENNKKNLSSKEI